MAAYSIPNLNTLRSSRPPGRGRGRMRGRGPPGVGNGDEDPASKDSIIQGTDSDALGSRLSAVNAGYLQDPYIRHFYTDGIPPTRFPIINRGTYVRTRAIDRLVTSFLSSKTDKVKQIISLGAGKDTRYFRLVKELKSARFIYHELDFTTNTSEKVKLIKRTPELISTITAYSEKPVDEITFTEDQLFSSTYNIHAIDLRTISSTGLPSLQNLNPSAPTLILSECCLCYLSPTHNAQILEAFTQHLIPAPTPLSIVIYEPIRPNDNFGRVMVSNLASRGIVLQTLQKFENLVAQQSRLKNAGFTSSQHAADVNFIWDQWVDAEEKERVARCEMLDEIEEWILLAKHYCIVWGWREPDHEELIGEAWSELQSQDED